MQLFVELLSVPATVVYEALLLKHTLESALHTKDVYALQPFRFFFLTSFRPPQHVAALS